ncbi:PLDc N-terminal domain-containing protein [Actinobaculum suis]|uniref:PLD nuclease N-terminal domain-containing protein n=2 Tax=Actinobaculum suis TaxID=1657 RepID=A0AAW9HGH0_9ACTO|nr:PLD nuclease N-terminal domain-containing protein [Actinobaculum suis]MDY5152947.1 PLD nuclease N-terminal domain-containing protein [Actinobaculum suis]
MARVLMALFAVTVWVYGIVDCVRTDQSQVPGRLAKSAWIALTVVLPVLGSVLWIALSWPLKYPTGSISLGGQGLRRDRPRRSGQVAPDDDPEFLSRLDARVRFREWERQQREAATAQDVATEPETSNTDRGRAENNRADGGNENSQHPSSGYSHGNSARAGEADRTSNGGEPHPENETDTTSPGAPEPKN